MEIRVNILFIRLVFIILAIHFNIACVMEDVSGGSSSSTNGGNTPGVSNFVYPGCVDGQGVGTNTILINFLFPPEASSVRIKRNGNVVAEFSQNNMTTSHVDDDGLREGATYLYTCEAMVDGLWAEGTNALQLSTLAVSAPVFNGIKDAVVQSATSVLVTWDPSVVDLPVSAFKYQIYATLGPNVDWSALPRAEVLHGSPGQVTITGLADELNYSFGVRACSEGDVCETNTIQKTVMTADGGAPTSPGATAVILQDLRLKITAPWQESNGGITRRYVYVRTGATGGTNIGNYTLTRTYQLTGSELYNPPQLLELTAIQEGETYHIIVQDEDPSGQRSAVTQFQSITVTDLNPPSFGGITGLVIGTPTDTQITASWTAIETEAVNPTDGGLKYRVFMLSSSSPISSNPCSIGSQIAELDVANYVAGSTVNYNINALTERTFYSVCVKAVDSVGNISLNTNFLQTNTQDITAPAFIGIENMAYNNQSAALSVTWNASTSSDIKEYRVKLWSNQPTPPPSPIVIVRSHASASTGTLISNAEYAVNNGDQVYANVEACDATQSPFGTQNCTNLGTQRSVILSDIQPPPNFLGVRGPTDLEVNAQGEVLVKWYAPANWSDYRGFKIYQVDPSNQNLSLLRTCPCADYGCSNNLTECLITGLDSYRTYRFHVRAYDNLNNETVYLDPVSSYADKRTIDTTAPTFSSNLVIGASPNFTLSWSAATDNQYASEPGAKITYLVYQKNAPFNFSIPTQPDGNLKTSTQSLSFQDSGFVEGDTYYYTVCAQDSSNNRYCDQIERSITVPDVTLPEITNLRSDKTTKSKVWELSWDMQDNISTSNNLYVEIRSRTSTTGELATSSDPIIYGGFGSSVIVSGNSASTSQVLLLEPLSGDPDVKRTIDYLVTIRDEAGNISSSNVSVDYDNTIQVTRVRATQGSLAGGQMITVYGKGFAKGSQTLTGEDTLITVGGNNCTSVQVISNTALTCTVPASASPGSVEVRAKTKVNNPASSSNNLYSEAALTNAYTYSSTPTLCNNPGSWGPQFASGSGVSSASPYIICDVTHLNNARAIATTGAYFKLGKHIDLNSISFNPLGTSAAKFRGSFDGDYFTISNWTYNNAQPNIGIFGYVNGNFEITNLGLVNVNVTAQQSVSALIGLVEGGSNLSGLISNVFVTGTVIGDDFVGGLIGRKQGVHTNFNVIDSYFIGNLQANGVTGYGGGIGGFMGPDVGGYFQNVYSEGSITGSKILGGLFGNFGQDKQLVSSYSRANVTAVQSFAGGLAGEVKLGAQISQSYAKDATISGVDSVGGLVGLLEGSMSNSYSNNSVTSTGRRGGGAVGYLNAGSITNVYSTKDLNLNNSAGGVVGEALNANITNIYSMGDIVSSGTDVGGAIGKYSLGSSINKSISKAYAKGFVDTSGSAVGGLIGTVDLLGNATLNTDQVFAEAQVGSNFTLPNQQYGGLIGKVNTQSGSTMNLSNCYAQGEVYGGNYVGGLVGGYDTATGLLTVTKCYSSAAIYGGATGRGGIFGQSQVASHSVNYVYWDTQVSTKAFVSGSGGVTGTATGYTTAEMLDYSNSIYTTWDFTNIWLIPSDPTYPLLQFE